MNRQWLLMTLALAAFLPGCDEGPDMQALCAEREGCLGGNDMDLEACVVAFEGARDGAHDIGCGEEYDALIDCLTAASVCSDGKMCTSFDDCNGSACIDGTCKEYGLDIDNSNACEQETNAYDSCS